jgi:hypothetical protein
MRKIAGSGSESGSIIVNSMNPQIRIHTKMSWIRNTACANAYSITLLLRSPRGTQSFLLLTRPKDRQASGILYSLTCSFKIWPHLVDALAKPFELSSEFCNFCTLHDDHLRVKSLQASALHFFGLSFFFDPAMLILPCLLLISVVYPDPDPDWIRIRIGSGFNGIPESGSGFRRENLPRKIGNS